MWFEFLCLPIPVENECESECEYMERVVLVQPWYLFTYWNTLKINMWVNYEYAWNFIRKMYFSTVESKWWKILTGEFELGVMKLTWRLWWFHGLPALYLAEKCASILKVVLCMCSCRAWQCAVHCSPAVAVAAAAVSAVGSASHLTMMKTTSTSTLKTLRPRSKLSRMEVRVCCMGQGGRGSVQKRVSVVFQL